MAENTIINTSLEIQNWTPRVDGGSVVGVGTYSIQQGTYQQIGKMLFVSGRVEWSAHTGTGDMRLANIPVNPATSPNTLYIGSLEIGNINFPGGTAWVDIRAEAATAFYLMMGNADNAAETATPMDGSGFLRFSIFYPVD